MSLLIHEQPLMVLPELAAKIGLNEAIILQQIHYWQSRSNNMRDGKAWVYNSAVDWQEQFPFWSVNTIRRALTGLRRKELVYTARYNRDPRDKTLWYSINYGHSALIPSDAPFTQNGQMEVPKMGNASTQDGQTHQPNVGKPLPETTTETTTEKKYTDQREAMNDAFELFWTAGMVKVGKAKAKAKFEKLVRDGKEEPEAFARKLVRDVKARLAAQVFGFDRLHPTTYLNGERWNDEVVQGDLPPNVRSFDEHRQRADVEVKRGPVRGRPIPYGSTQPDDDGILTLPNGTRCHVDDWDAGNVAWEGQV